MSDIRAVLKQKGLVMLNRAGGCGILTTTSEGERGVTIERECPPLRLCEPDHEPLPFVRPKRVARLVSTPSPIHRRATARKDAAIGIVAMALVAAAAAVVVTHPLQEGRSVTVTRADR